MNRIKLLLFYSNENFPFFDDAPRNTKSSLSQIHLKSAMQIHAKRFPPEGIILSIRALIHFILSHVKWHSAVKRYQNEPFQCTYSTVQYSSHLPLTRENKMQTDRQQTNTLNEWIWIESMIHHPRHHCRDESTLNHSTQSSIHNFPHQHRVNPISIHHSEPIQIGIFALLYVLDERNTIPYAQLICMLYSKSDTNWKIMFCRHGWWLVMMDKNMHSRHINWTVFGQTPLWWPSMQADTCSSDYDLYAFSWSLSGECSVIKNQFLCLP